LSSLPHLDVYWPDAVSFAADLGTPPSSQQRFGYPGRSVLVGEDIRFPAGASVSQLQQLRCLVKSGDVVWVKALLHSIYDQTRCRGGARRVRPDPHDDLGVKDIRFAA
jgi:hypothetical protein